MALRRAPGGSARAPLPGRDVRRHEWAAEINISGLGQTDAELALADNVNLFIQTAGVYREDFIQGVVRRFGADRVLYASAFPVLDPRLEVRRVQWASFSPADEGALLGGNAARLFGLDSA